VVHLVQQTETFIAWHHRLKDRIARIAIARRLENVEAGTLGDVKPVGGGVSELRVEVGPGYRLYFTMRKRVVVVLLCGGDKKTQDADIRRAKKIAEEIEK
jgi:putative addiction module killer protein